MPNFVPYLILVLISLTLIYWMIFLRKEYKLIFIILTYSGMVYVFEYVVLVLWNSYEFFPTVLSIRYHDNVLGSIISNFIFLPVIALIISVFKMRLIWIIIFSLLITAIEYWFVQLNVYKNYSWEHHYTLISLILYFVLTKLWYQKLKKKIRWMDSVCIHPYVFI